MIFIKETNEYMIKLNTEVKVFRNGYAILQGCFPKDELENITLYIPNNASKYIIRLNIGGNTFLQKTISSRYQYNNNREIVINLSSHYFITIPIRFYSDSKAVLTKLKLIM